jgi:hypothetical protein
METCGATVNCRDHHDDDTIVVDHLRAVLADPDTLGWVLVLLAAI